MRCSTPCFGLLLPVVSVARRHRQPNTTKLGTAEKRAKANNIRHGEMSKNTRPPPSKHAWTIPETKAPQLSDCLSRGNEMKSPVNIVSSLIMSKKKAFKKVPIHSGLSTTFSRWSASLPNKCFQTVVDTKRCVEKQTETTKGTNQKPQDLDFSPPRAFFVSACLERTSANTVAECG